MEPMNLGSPTHTYPSSGVGSGVPGGGGYLPGYLMGDPHLSPASPMFSRQLSSPNKLNRSMSNQSTMSMSTVGGMVSGPTTPLPSSSRGPALLRETLNNSGRLQSRSDKPGPPTMSLLAGLTPNSTINSPMHRLDNTGGFDGTPSRSQLIHNQVEDDDPLAVWVTVFGFPPSASQYILSQMSTCGTVLQHNQPPNANWIHIRFQTRLQARKAGGKNGTIFGGSIMVGVVPCTEDSVLDQVNTSMGALDSSACGASSVANLSSTFGTPRTIRPLTQAYKEAQGDYKVVPMTNTPNKNTGMVSKAMECMFGW